MKSAIVFLVALTVSFSLFLESSTAAVDSTASEGSGIVNAGASISNENDLIVLEAISKLNEGFETIINNIGQAVKSINAKDRIKVDEADKQRLYKAMETARGAIARAVIITDKPEIKGPKGKGEADKNRTLVNIWLKILLVTTTRIHIDITVAVNAGWVKAIKNATAETVEAVAKAKTEWAVLEKTLKGKVREDANREMNINFANAAIIEAILKGLLSDTVA